MDLGNVKKWFKEFSISFSRAVLCWNLNSILWFHRLSLLTSAQSVWEFRNWGNVREWFKEFSISKESCFVEIWIASIVSTNSLVLTSAHCVWECHTRIIIIRTHNYFVAVITILWISMTSLYPIISLIKS